MDDKELTIGGETYYYEFRDNNTGLYKYTSTIFYKIRYRKIYIFLLWSWRGKDNPIVIWEVDYKIEDNRYTKDELKRMLEYEYYHQVIRKREIENGELI